jgi:hypothetical protein
LLLCPNQALLLGNAELYRLGNNFEGGCFQVLHQDFHLYFQGFEHVLVSAGNVLSGDITEGSEVSDWIGIGFSVSEVMGILEYVFVGIRK